MRILCDLSPRLTYKPLVDHHLVGTERLAVHRVSVHVRIGGISCLDTLAISWKLDESFVSSWICRDGDVQSISP